MKREENLVSVIIPCYNHGKFIRKAIKSVQNQTYQNFEIIIVDDGSDDDKTIRILEDINLPKTKVYRKTNGGPASARNFAIQKSSGQYILTLDADDQFHPTFLEKGIKILENRSDIGIVTSYLIRVYEDSFKRVQIKGGDISAFVLKNEANGSILFRYQCWEATGGYDEQIPGFEDWEFAIGVTYNGWNVYSIPEYLFYYRKTQGSQFDRDEQNRPVIMKYLINKYKDAYKDNITEILYAKELQIQKCTEVISTYKNSYSQKIGSSIIKPVKALRSHLFFL